MPRSLLALLTACTAALAPVSAQGVAGLRISPCLGWATESLQGPLCNVAGFVETPDFGVFLQVRPIGGPILENWQLYIYRPITRFELFGLHINTLPGIAIGVEGGTFFVGAQADIIISITWPPTSGVPP